MDDFSADEFVQGFLEEAGDHLLMIHQNLLRLEDILAQPEPDDQPLVAQILDDLFRSFHTIKGLAGMVRLDEAASFSHSIETLLQSLRTGQARLDGELLDLMVEAVKALEGIIDGLRRGEEAAQDGRHAGEIMERIQRALAPEPEAQKAAAAAAQAPAGAHSDILAVVPDLAAYPTLLASLGELERQKIQQAAADGQFFWLVFFLPSAEKSARGINVDHVRFQLAEAGDLIKSAPVMESGTVRFAFLVATRQPLEEAGLPVDEMVLLAARPVQARSGRREAPARAGRSGQSSFIRVELARLDDLVQFASDLVILRARLEDGLARLDGGNRRAHRELRETSERMGRSLKSLRQAILRARMVPLAEVFNPMPLVARDLARSTGKEVRLRIEGESTEVDKVLVEGLLDPLIHLVRNAIIHGIEPPAERIAAGKPRQGTVLLRGLPEGDRILVEVRDDGRGLDMERIEQKARDLGRLDAPAGRALTGEEALALVSQSGFTTLDEANLGAGRGVGLDIVQKMVRSFGGSMALQTAPGRGAAFQVRLPLTLVMMDGLVVQSGGERYAAPRSMVDEVIEIDPGAVVRAESGELYQHRGHPVVLHRLERLLDIPPGEKPAGRTAFGLVRRLEDRQDALVVDRVLGLRELVVRPVTDPLVAQPGIEGATELGDGQVVLILDLPALFRAAG